MANNIKLGDSQPVSKELKPLKVDGKTTSIELAEHGKGAKVTGDLGVLGDLTIGEVLSILASGNNVRLTSRGRIEFKTGTGGYRFYYDDNSFIALTVFDGSHLSIQTQEDGHLTLKGNELTLDSETIELNADGGTVTIKDASASHFLFDCDNTRFRIYDDTNAADFFDITVAAEGATTIATTDDSGAVAHLTLDPDGEVRLDSGADSGYTRIYNAGTSFADFSVHHGAGWLSIYSEGDSGTNDVFRIAVLEHGNTEITTEDWTGSQADLKFNIDGNIRLISTDTVSSDVPLKIKESASAVADTAAYGQLWVKDEAPCELYFTTDAGDDIQLTDGTSTAGGGGGGGTAYWHQQVPGYKTALNSATYYYTFYRMWYENWSNVDSSPSSIHQTDSYASFFIAPRAGTVTNMKIQGYVTGVLDPIKFYIKKASLQNDGTSVSLTDMFNTSAITPPTTSRT